MRFKQIPGTVLLVLCVLFSLTACSPASQKTISTNDDSNVINELLLKEHYEISSDKNERIIYLFNIEDNKATSQKYEIKNNDSISVNLAKNYEFILSMPSNKSSLYFWKPDDELDGSLLSIKGINWIKPFKFTNIISSQDKYRQNFSLKTLRAGKQTVKFTYWSKKDELANFSFDIAFEVK